MKKTYTNTLMHKDLTKATILLDVYENTKYESNADEAVEVSYNNVTAWDIIEGGKEAEEIEAHTDGSCIDEYHEYLVLHFADGTESTFRNSHVEMFVLQKRKLNI